MKSGKLYNPIGALIIIALIIYALMYILPWVIGFALIFFIVKYSIVLYKKDSKLFFLISKILVSLIVIISLLIYCTNQSSERNRISKQGLDYITRTNVKANVTKSIIYNHINDSLNQTYIDYDNILKIHLSSFDNNNDFTYQIYHDGDINGVVYSVSVYDFDECLKSLKESFKNPHFDSVVNDTLDSHNRIIKWEFDKLHILMSKDSGYYTSCFIAVFNPDILSDAHVQSEL